MGHQNHSDGQEISRSHQKEAESQRRGKSKHAVNEEKLKEQVELALPLHHSPDDKLKALRH